MRTARAPYWIGTCLSPVIEPHMRPTVRSSIRLLASAASLAFTVACGGVSESGPAAPPVASVATTVSVVAGSDQLGEPGTAVALQPSIVVKDQNGRAMASVAVTFAIDSGGGAVSGASTTTGADGVATAGAWTLGTTAGRNVMSATVASLTPVRFLATGRFTEQTLVSGATVPTSGGTIVFDKPGDLNRGVEVTVPAESYPTPTTWTVTASRGSAPPLPPGAFLLGPAVRITNNQGYADSVMTLSIPVRAGQDTAVAAFYYDSASAWLEPVPVIARTATSVMIGTRHFSADKMLTPSTESLDNSSIAGLRSTGAGRSSSNLAFGSIVIVVVGVKQSFLATRVGSSFAPGIDDWEFANRGAYIEPKGICAGMQITALYYNYRYKPVQGTLFHRYDRVVSLDYDSPGGIRLASMVQYDIDWSNVNKWTARLNALARTSGWPSDVLHYHSLILSMFVTGRPQYLSVRPPTGGGHALVAYEVNQGVIKVSDPNHPGAQGTTITYNPQSLSFTPFPFAGKVGAPPQLMGRIQVVGVSAMIDLSALDARWKEMKGGTIGNGKFPRAQLDYYDQLTKAWKPLSAGTVVHYDSLRTRTNCVRCSATLVRTPDIETQPTYVYNVAGVKKWAAWDAATNVLQRTGMPITPGNNEFGFQSDGIASTDPIDDEFITFDWITFKSMPTRIVKVQASYSVNQPGDLAVKHGNTHPAGATYKWVFENAGIQDIVTMVGDTTVQYTFKQASTYSVAVDVTDKSGVLIGHDESTVNVETLTISPSSQTVGVAQSFTLTATRPSSYRPATRFEWTMGDGRVLNTTTPALTTSYPASAVVSGVTTFPVSLAIFEGATMYGRASATVLVATGSIQFSITGVWDPLKTPTNGNYAYTDFNGGKVASPGGSGLDWISFALNLATDSTIGVLVSIFTPTGVALKVGDVFAKVAPGARESAGTFQLTLSQDQNNVMNSTQYAPGTAGTLRINALTAFPNGSTLAQYSFTITNGGGGTIGGSGVAVWK